MYSFTPGTPKKLDTQTYNQPVPVPPPPMALTIVKPVSYQFQVAEYEKDGVIVKVELQVQATTHDEFGNVINSSGFQPVPRVKVPYIDHK